LDLEVTDSNSAALTPAKKVIPIVESEVRRSPRLKRINKGFKPESCAGKKCRACNPNPPDMSLSLIKNLGANLCQIDENILSEKALNQKVRKSSNASAVTNAVAQKKGKISKAQEKKQMKENKKPKDVGPDAQLEDTEQMEEEDAREEEDVDPAFTGKAAGKKKSKK
jgi:hypothetical protein